MYEIEEDDVELEWKQQKWVYANSWCCPECERRYWKQNFRINFVDYDDEYQMNIFNLTCPYGHTFNKRDW